LFLTSKSFGNFQSSGEFIVDSNQIIFSLLDKFYFFGIYEVFELNGQLIVKPINIDKNNVSYTELAFYDFEKRHIVIADKPSLTGNHNVINIFTLKNGAIDKKCDFFIDWSKYSKKISNSNDEYLYYKLIQKEISTNKNCK